MERLGFSYFASREPGRLAVIGPRGDTWTRGQLARLVNSLARGLLDLGLKPDDRVAILSPNCVEFLAIYLAATQVGLYVATLNWHLAASEITHILKDSQASVLFVHRDIFAATVAPLPAEVLAQVRLISIGEVDGVQSMSNLAASFSGDPLERTLPGTTLIYTSATTGLPKAVVKSRDIAEAGLARELELVAQNTRRMGVPPDSETMYLCISMLYHIATLNGAVYTLHIGNPLTIMNGWSAVRILEEIQRSKVKTTFMVPAMFVRLLKLPADVRNSYDLSSLVCITHGGAPCPVDVKRQMIEWVGPILFESYGASEGGGTMVESADWLRYPGTVGRPFPGGGIRILDDDGNEMPAGGVGNIYIKPYNNTTFEYLGDRTKTDAAWRDGYFTVGDVGYVNEEGFLFICDRRTDMIISSGMKIYSAEVERVLITHPAIKDCAVVGVADPVLGEAAVAVVELEDSMTGSAQLSGDILSFLLERLGSMKVPRRIHYVEQLPRDPSGKLFKRLLKDKLPA